MNAARPRRQRGAALLALLLILALGGSWYLVAKLDTLQVDHTARQRERNAEVLQRAKRALIGYVAAQAGRSGEDNPGALPCPEHPWYIGMPDREGTMGPAVGVPNPGYGSASCSSIGRFPWRSIGTEPLFDARGEPLWYVVGPAWRKTSSSTLTTINSNSTGDLAVDGQAVVAMLVAPGAAMNAQAGTTPAGTACSARNQARSAAAGTMNAADYLECFNAGTLQFSSNGPATSFNDQVVTITAAELMPAIEAAIADRIGREIAPALRGVYAGGTLGIGGTRPLYPYPAPFANPSTSSYRGVAGQTAGLLPFFQTQGCNPATDPRCTTATTGGSAFLVFSKNAADVQTGGLGTIRTQSTCAWQAEVYVCTGEYLLLPISVRFRLRVTNVAMGLRAFDTSKVTCSAVDDVGAGLPEQNIGCGSVTAALQSDGSAIVTVDTNLTPDILTSGWGTYAQYKISFDRAVFGDHSLLSSTDATTGWFVRNEWYRLLYYAVARGHTAEVLAGGTPACPTTNPPYTFASSCISVANVMPAGSQRAVLILAGRSINGVARPSGTLADYLEAGNATGSFERQTVTASTGQVYLDVGIADEYILASGTPVTGQPLRFRASNANTGPSRLTSLTTGTRDLVDSSGASLSAGRIQANAVVEATYDGTRFLLSKRIFNDRVIVVQSN